MQHVISTHEIIAQKHEETLVPPIWPTVAGDSSIQTGPGEDQLTPCDELKISPKTSPEFAMTLDYLDDQYHTNNGGHSVLKRGASVVALAMRTEQNPQAPVDQAAHGIFWGRTGPGQRLDNDALARTAEPIDVWVSTNREFADYQPMGRYQVMEMPATQEMLTIANGPGRRGRNRVDRFFNLLRVGDIEEHP